MYRRLPNSVWDMGYVDGMVYGNMGKPQYVVWYVLTVWYGKTDSILYGTFAVWYYGTMSWMHYMAKFAWYVDKAREGRIRRTNIICNELIMSRPLESVRKHKPCGHTYRQTDRQTDG